MALKQEDGDIDIPVSQKQNLRKTPRKSLDPSENGHARKSMRSSLKPTAEYEVRPKRHSLDDSSVQNGGDSFSGQRRRRRYAFFRGRRVWHSITRQLSIIVSIVFCTVKAAFCFIVLDDDLQSAEWKI